MTISELQIDISEQHMEVIDASGSVIRDYPVSTAANGPGEVNGSGCTPRGEHVIRAKIGDGEPVNTVFIGRRPTGEIYESGMREKFPERDWILTRILWLSGCEPGINRLGNLDSMRRYIYLHGTPDEVELGKPGSAGCIRMRNEHIVELFNMVTPGTKVILRD